MARSLAERVAAVEVIGRTNQEEIKSVSDRLEKLQFWMMATFGGVVTAVLLLIAEVLLKKV